MGFLSQEPRDRLIAAAAELCAVRGYEEMREEEIAARAGLPVETMRRIFPGGREECLVAAENAILHGVVAAVARSYEADRPESESVIRGVKAILEMMAENPGFAYMGYVFSRQMAPGSVRELNEMGHRMVEAMLERGWDYSQTSGQPAKAALGILGGAQALVRRELAAGRPDRLPLLLPDCTYIATVPFLGQKEALRLSRQARDLLEEDAAGV